MNRTNRYRWLTLYLTLLLFPWSAHAQAPTALTCFINHTWYPVSSFEGIIPDEITRITGTTLNVTVANSQEQLSQMILTGNLPDLVYTSTLQARLSDPALCYSYDELIDQYGLDWNISPALHDNALAFSSDGKIYALLNNYATDDEWFNSSAVPITGSLFVRTDVLDALGISRIDTLEELHSVLLLVKERYPDMVPLTFDAVHRFNIFKCYFGLGLLTFIPSEDGSYHYYARDERYYQMLRYLNKLYLDGCMLTDNFVATESEAGLLYSTGSAFSFSACTQISNLYFYNELQAIDPSFRSDELLPLQGSVFDAQGLGWSSVFISRTASDPEACIRLIQWMFSPEGQRITEWGRYGIDYTLDEKGLPVFNEQYLQCVNSGNLNNVYNPWFYFGTSALTESQGRCAILGDVYPAQTYQYIREHYHSHPWITAAQFNLPPDQANRFNQLESLTSEYESKIILSSSPETFECNWQEMLRYFDSMCLQEIEDSITALVPQYDLREQE